MLIKIKLDGEIVCFELFLPSKIMEFLTKNNINKNIILNNENWIYHIVEDLEQYEEVDFKKAKIVINYIFLEQSNKIRVESEDFSNGSIIKSSTIIKGNFSNGAFSEQFSLGYSIFRD